MKRITPAQDEAFRTLKKYFPSATIEYDEYQNNGEAILTFTEDGVTRCCWINVCGEKVTDWS